MKINITGDVFIITSKLTVADIALVAKNKPDALKVFEGEGIDREQKFAVSFNDGKPSIANFGITFGSKTRCAKGFAFYRGDIPSTVVNAKDYVADIIGTSADFIKIVEEQVPTAIEEIKKARTSLLADITLDGENAGDSTPTDNKSNKSASKRSGKNASDNTADNSGDTNNGNDSNGKNAGD